MKLWLKRIALFLAVLFILGSVAAISFFVGVASGIFFNASETVIAEEVISGEEEKAKIGILTLDGIILSSGINPSFTGLGMISSSQVSRWLRELKKDEALKGVVLEINSPGGSPVASDEIYQALTDFKTSGKSLVVKMGETAASGGYFISLPADRIYANPATLTGSIGVISEIANIDELLGKIGVDIEVYKSGAYKDLTSISRERTEEEKRMIKEYINAAYNLFVQRIVEGRGMDEAKVREVAQGQIYSGIKAQELGLIDELGSLDDAVSEVKRLEQLDSVKVVRLRTESAFEMLFGKISSTFNPYLNLILKLNPPGFRAMYLPAF